MKIPKTKRNFWNVNFLVNIVYIKCKCKICFNTIESNVLTNYVILLLLLLHIKIKIYNEYYIFLENNSTNLQIIGILKDKFANLEMLHSNIPNDSPYEINVFIYHRPFVKIKYKYAVCCFAVDIVEIIWNQDAPLKHFKKILK